MNIRFRRELQCFFLVYYRNKSISQCQNIWLQTSKSSLNISASAIKKETFFREIISYLISRTIRETLHNRQNVNFSVQSEDVRETWIETVSIASKLSIPIITAVCEIFTEVIVSLLPSSQLPNPFTEVVSSDTTMGHNGHPVRSNFFLGPTSCRGFHFFSHLSPFSFRTILSLSFSRSSIILFFS